MLFAIGNLFNVMGVNVTAFSQAMTGALGSLVVHPGLSDFYIVLPGVVLAVGLLRWRRSSARAARKAAASTHESLRRFCVRCGAQMEPGETRCRACGQRAPGKAEGYCDRCGKRVRADATFCWFCGEAVQWRGEAECGSCGGAVARSSRYCPRCGSKLVWPIWDQPPEGDGSGAAPPQP